MSSERCPSPLLLHHGARVVNYLLRPLGCQVSRFRHRTRAEHLRKLAADSPNLAIDLRPGLLARYGAVLDSGLPWLAHLSHRYAVKVWADEQGLFARFNDVTIEVNASEELMIAYEVFGQSEYYYSGPRETVVLDFGMNVGLASLYFAGRSGVERVYAYEPFPTTFQGAERNLTLNRHLAAKIEAHNFGVGAEATTVRCLYDPLRKGCCGSNARLDLLPDLADRACEAEDIELKPAGEEVFRIRKLHPQTDLIIKMDIEGAEATVLPHLAKSGALRLVTAIFLEWHYHWPSNLVDILTANGFGVHIASARTDVNGKIYAFRVA